MLNFFKDKRILITGCTGFKGSWLCEMLLCLGAKDICGYSLGATNTTLFNDLHLHESIKYVEGDILDFQSLSKVVEDYKPEIVIHLAAQPIVLEGYKNPRLTYETNVLGTVNVLEACRLSNSVKTILNVTTDKVYRNTENGDKFIETDTLCGQDPYSNSKSCSELVTDCYDKSYLGPLGRAVCTARAGNVIGGGDFSPNRIVPDCVRALLNGNTIEVRNPYSIRPYQHVLDVLYAYLLIVKKSYEKGISDNFNVGPDDSSIISTGDLATRVCNYWGEGSGWESDWNKEYPIEAKCLKLDCTKIKRVLGWTPKISIEDAIKLTVNWYKNTDDIKTYTDNQIHNFLKEI